MSDLGNMGIYAIVNKKTGRTYIGATAQSFERRFKSHVTLLDAGTHRNRDLQTDWNRFKGVKGFRFSVLESIKNPKHLSACEMKWVEHFGQNGTSLYNRSNSKGLGLHHFHPVRNKVIVSIWVDRNLRNLGHAAVKLAGYGDMTKFIEAKLREAIEESHKQYTK